MLSLAPQALVTPEDRERGLTLLVREAAFSGGTAALTTGVILTAFALHLGASNVMIGVLASAPFLAQLLQLPAIGMVERWRNRKAISVATSLIGRAMLAVMAVLAARSARVRGTHGCATSRPKSGWDRCSPGALHG
jgi:hypothetical protein